MCLERLAQSARARPCVRAARSRTRSRGRARLKFSPTFRAHRAADYSMEPRGWAPVVAAAALGAAAATCVRSQSSSSDGSAGQGTASTAARQRWKKLAVSMSKERVALHEAAALASPRWSELVNDVLQSSRDGALGAEHAALMRAAGAEDARLEQKGFRKGDTLVVVDMQNDFVPGAAGGGRLGTSEGQQISPLICEMIAAAAASGAKVVATRDYHPRSHCSFDANGGPFPVHCVQGCTGSQFFPPIAEALNQARKESASATSRFSSRFHEPAFLTLFSHQPSLHLSRSVSAE